MAFRDLMRAPKLAADYANYAAWLAKDSGQRSVDYAALNVQKLVVARKDGWIYPFNQKSNNLYTPVRIPNVAITTDASCVELMRALTGTPKLVLETAPAASASTTEEEVFLEKYKFARLTVSRRLTDTPSPQTSRMTKRAYKKYETNAASCPFGQDKATVDHDYNQAVTSIKAGGTNWTATPGQKYIFTPEMGNVNTR